MSISVAAPNAVETLDDTLPQSAEERQRTAELSRSDGLPPGAASGFDLIRPIGEGAYGSVWLAKERKTGRFAAVKFYTRRGQDWLLLGREVEKLAALDTSHHIVGLIDVGWESDPPYYVMEYLPNGSLAGYLAAGAIPAPQAVELARGILQGLVHAHGAGILHCDLKPANVLLDQDVHPRLCDFGQARLSEEERPALGTLFYMAPEQADLKAMPDVRWDVYAFGAILYHMLTGRPPHRTPEAEAELAAAADPASRLAAYRRLIRKAGPPTDHRALPGVDKRLASIVERCLAPSPSDRFRNAQAVLDALDSRDRERSRRPLVALGLVGPLLLLAAMAPFFLTTMRNAVRTAKSNVVDRALQSDALAARLFAANLGDELDERRFELQRIAADSRFRSLVEQTAAGGWADRGALDEMLSARREEADARRLDSELTPDTSWFLQDAEGYQRWRLPLDEKTHDQPFHWRDYFHGQGKEYDPNVDRRTCPPITLPYVSTIFRSNATKQYMVAISTPVFAEDGTTVIAVLARTQHLWDLLEDYKRGAGEREADEPHAGSGSREEREGQVLALIDSRDWRVVTHPWMDEENVKKLSDEDERRLMVPAGQADEIERLLTSERVTQEGEAVTVDGYRDPVAQNGFAPDAYGGEWLAAFRPVAGTSRNGTGWLAVVQERKDAVLAPAERMKSDLLLYAVAALVVGGGLVVTFWYFVTQALTERAGTLPRRSAAAVDGTSATP